MNFLRDFLIYNDGNECPKEYILWAGYAALSATTGRRTFIDIDLDNLFVIPNIYVLLVGPSGSRKNVSLYSACDILREACPDTVFAGSNETYQGVLKFLDHENQERDFVDHTGGKFLYHPYCIFVGEFMDYLQNNPQAMITFLTNIYDSRDYLYRLKTQEDQYISRPYVVLCGGTTPIWLTDQLKTKQFTEGYGRRTIIVCSSEIIRRRPVLSKESIEAKKRCVIRLREIHKLVGQVKLTPDAEGWFWDWYVKGKSPDDAFLQAWSTTKHINTLKVALLTSLSERDDLQITLDIVKQAVKLLDHVEKKLPMVTSLMGRNETSQAVQQLFHILKNHAGKMSYKELKLATLSTFKNTMEQYSTMQYLKNEGRIVIVTEKVNGVSKEFVGLPQNIVVEPITTASPPSPSSAGATADPTSPSPQPDSSSDTSA